MSDVVNGRQAVREALRGRREVGQVWASRARRRLWIGSRRAFARRRPRS